ncbi:MAG: hypothetical protein ACM3O3_09755 [Syntrophothermus sp.]
MNNLKGNKTPCYGCLIRVIGCHVTCIKYAGYLKKNEEINNKKYKKVIVKTAGRSMIR